MGEGAPLLTRNMWSWRPFRKKSENMNSFQSAGPRQTAKALGKPPFIAPPSLTVSLSVSLSACLSVSVSLTHFWVSLFPHLAMTAAAPSGQDKGSWGHGSSLLRLGELWKGPRSVQEETLGPLDRQRGAQKLLKISRFRFQSICGARLLTRVARAFSLASAAVGLRWRPLSWKGSRFQALPSWVQVRCRQ